MSLFDIVKNEELNNSTYLTNVTDGTINYLTYIQNNATIKTSAVKKSVFFCQNCGHEENKWLGQCPMCKEWNTFAEEAVSDKLEGVANRTVCKALFYLFTIKRKNSIIRDKYHSAKSFDFLDILLPKNISTCNVTAAIAVTLGQYNLHALTCRSNRRAQARRTAANNQNICVAIACWSLSADFTMAWISGAACGTLTSKFTVGDISSPVSLI